MSTGGLPQTSQDLRKAWTGGDQDPPVVRGLFVGCDYRNAKTSLPDGNNLDTKGHFGSDALKLYTHSLLFEKKIDQTQSWIQQKYASALVEDGQIPDEKEFSKEALNVINNRPAYLSGRPLKSTILTRLNVLASVSRTGDVAWFHFCGHGDGGAKSYAARVLAMAGRTLESFLVCSSESPLDPDAVQMISRREFNAVLAKFQKGVQLIITLDSYYSRDMITNRGLLITATTDDGFTLFAGITDKNQYTMSFSVMLASLDVVTLDPKTNKSKSITYADNQKVLQGMADQISVKAKVKVTVMIRDPEGIKDQKSLSTGMCL